MKCRYINTGVVTDLDTGREYTLAGVKLSRNNHVVTGGQGYVLAVYEQKNLPNTYILEVVTEASFLGSVAGKLYEYNVATLKNFTYKGNGEI